MVKKYNFEEFKQEFYSQPSKEEVKGSRLYELGRKIARESLEDADKILKKEKACLFR